MTNKEQLLTSYFQANRNTICAYIARRIPHAYNAEDLTQDVFIKLWNIRQIICEATIKSLVFTVANNIVIDQLRKYVRRRSYYDYATYYGEGSTNSTVERVEADDLAETEMKIVKAMPLKRRQVYILSRYDDKSIDDIAVELHMGRRTVETHLFLGRKEIRRVMARCV